MTNSKPLTKNEIIGSFVRDLTILFNQLNDLSRSIFQVPPNQKLRLNQQQYKLLIARNTFNVMFVRSVAPLMRQATPRDPPRFDTKFVSPDQWLANFLQLNSEFLGKLDLLNQQLSGSDKKTRAMLVAYSDDFYNWFRFFVLPWYQNPLAPGPARVVY